MRPVMKSRAAAGLAFALFLAVVGVGRAHAETCDLTFSNGVRLAGIPVAATVDQQSKGLSDIDDIGSGLFFVWPNSEPRAFWMQNTRVPLTVGFIAEDGTLFGIEDMAVKPNSYHLSMRPAKAALEVGRGKFSELGLPEGVQLLKQDCQPSL